MVYFNQIAHRRDTFNTTNVKVMEYNIKTFGAFCVLPDTPFVQCTGTVYLKQFLKKNSSPI